MDTSSYFSLSTNGTAYDRWTSESPYVAAIVMALVVIGSFSIVLIFQYYHTIKNCCKNDSKIAAEVRIDQTQSNKSQTEIDLPPAYSTLSQK